MRLQMMILAPWQPVLKQLLRRLSGRGFPVRRTFDLQLARRSLEIGVGVVCPHHGSERCTCQYLVLQVGEAQTGASMLVVHGHDNTTKVALISAGGEEPDPAVAAVVCEAVQDGQRSARTRRKFAGYGEASGRAAMQRRTGILPKGEQT